MEAFTLAETVANLPPRLVVYAPQIAKTKPVTRSILERVTGKKT
jgi:hypothetical protein